MVQGWQGVSNQAKDFVKGCLCPEAQRFTAQQALDTEWIKKFGTLECDPNVAGVALENLKKYKSDQNLKSAAFSFIASQLLGKRERDALAISFRYFDKTGDGQLTMEELKQAYDHFKKDISEAELMAVFRSIDTDNSGNISFSEYLVAAMTEKSLTSADKLQAAFRMFDKDGSGLVSAEELSAILSQGNSADFVEMVKEYDVNGDGEISFEEFTTMMKKLSA